MIKILNRNFECLEPIEKGWSGDQKYGAVGIDGSKMLLRVAPAERYAEKLREHQAMQRVSELGIPMCQPIDFGLCDRGVCSLQRWVDGQDAEALIPLLPDTQQYVYGLDAGKVLRRIHSLSAPDGQEPWGERFGKKADGKIALYRQSPIGFEGAESMIHYIQHKKHLLEGRPQSLQHGDYHLGNMMIENGVFTIIDFNRWDYGDPWEEFNRIVWSAQASPLFASGLVNGYFADCVPARFWELLALYISSNTLGSVPWAIPFGQGEVDVMLRQAQEVIAWYAGMTKTVPGWYFSGYHLQHMDGIPFKLKSDFNFDFLGEYGRIFKVFDDQDSGNINFGVEAPNRERLFIKFAGAPTERYDGTPEEAVACLKDSIKIYRALAHPNLIRLLKAKEVAGGYAAVFEWAPGDCMGRMYPESRAAFMSAGVDEKRNIFKAILDFHLHVAACGYVAIDFYDGSILYDSRTKKTTICDIDLYAKMPYTNRMGRMWGSRRFMSPEEFTLGAPINERSNVYTMGATALQLFAGESGDGERWPLGSASYKVIQRAMSAEPALRQASIAEFMEEWKDSL